jgi:hypothetical protein
MEQVRTSAYLGYRIVNSKQFYTSFGNSEQYFETIITPKANSLESTYLAYPSLLYGHEIWTLNQRDIRLKTAEMKFMRRTTGYNILGHRRNEDILK